MGQPVTSGPVIRRTLPEATEGGSPGGYSSQTYPAGKRLPCRME